MRFFFAWLVIVLTTSMLFVWIVTPTIAGIAVSASLRAAGIAATESRVDVGTDPLLLAAGQARFVRITAHTATYDGLSLTGVDVIFSGVDLRHHSCAAVSGALNSLSSGIPGLRFGATEIKGSCDEMQFSVSLAASDAETLAALALGQATEGTPAPIVFMPPDNVTISLGGKLLYGRVLLDANGGVRLRIEDLERHTAFITPFITAEDLGPLVIHAVRVENGGIVLSATLSPSPQLP